MKDLCLKGWTPLEGMILAENQRQLDKWGIQNHDSFTWLGFATEELGETSKAISEFYFRNGLAIDVVKEAIETATLMIKIAEMFKDLIESSGQYDE